MSKPDLPPKRRRWRWIAMMGVFVILIWWLMPGYYRINDLAASLDQSDPGWRYEEIRQSQKPPPDEQNVVAWMKKWENDLPKLNGPGINPFQHEPTDDKDQQQIRLLRQRLDRMLAFPTAYREMPPWTMFISAIVQADRWDDWQTLLALEITEQYESKERTAIERATQLEFHHYFLHRLCLRHDLFTDGSCVCAVCNRFEQHLRETTFSEAMLRKLKLILEQADLLAWEKQSLRLSRADCYEMIQMLIQRSPEIEKNLAWHEKLMIPVFLNDFIESFTLKFEYLTYRLDQLNGNRAGDSSMQQLIEKVHKYEPKQTTSNLDVIKSWYRFQTSGS